VTARRRTSIACRKGTSRHPAIAAFSAAIREQSRLLGAIDGGLPAREGGALPAREGVPSTNRC
jgi:hypothetical protein